MSTPETTRSMTVRYGTRSEVATQPAGASVRLCLDGARGPVAVRGRVRSPELFRDALATVIGILGSDLRHRSRDRTAYLAYLAKQGKRATAAVWDAQKAFLEQSLGDDPRERAVLDPMLTVHPDEVSLEVFSRDASAYARLAFANGLFDDREAVPGTTFVHLSGELSDALDRLRTWAPVTLDAAVSRGEGGEARHVDVPYAWIRGFLQVQSAATVPAVSCELAPIDLYNLLFVLRSRRAKRSPRALRFELVPGAPPRMVLEPWEILLEGHGAAYQGSAPRVVRTFGRQRLLNLARILPWVRRARVHLAGAGLPGFWVLELDGATLTLGLTGWTERAWASAASFDALMPSPAHGALADAAERVLLAEGPQRLERLATALGASRAEARAALQLGCLRGRVLYDLARGEYRPRELLAERVDDDAIRYDNPREARALRLLGEAAGGDGRGQVSVTRVHEIAGEGTEIHGEVVDREAHRSFQPSFTLDLEGRAAGATCGCPTFRRAGMREGPCEHMLALGIAYVRRRAEAEALRSTPEGRRLIRAETRVFVRRDAAGAETVCRLSLDDRAVRQKWGPRAGGEREQRLWFDTDREAREAYFDRAESLAAEGFIDAEASLPWRGT